MTAVAPQPTQTTAEDEYAEELRRVKEIAERLGFEEVEDDGWGFRAFDTGSAPVGTPGPPGPGVTIEQASG